MEAEEASKVVEDCARMREGAARQNYTIAEAVSDARWLRRTPDAAVLPERARQTIDTLLAALEASPCFLKGAVLGIPTFTILAYDRAGHVAMTRWAHAAEDHGCRQDKVQEVRAKATEWALRTDCKWPD